MTIEIENERRSIRVYYWSGTDAFTEIGKKIYMFFSRSNKVFYLRMDQRYKVINLTGLIEHRQTEIHGSNTPNNE